MSGQIHGICSFHLQSAVHRGIRRFARMKPSRSTADYIPALVLKSAPRTYPDKMQMRRIHQVPRDPF